MSKNSLDAGFLVMYEWVPFMENLDAESFKEFFSAMIRRQRDGTPFPEFSDRHMNYFVPVIEATIKRRLTGQNNANVSLDKTNKKEDK